jgi:hypothetical protein
MSLISDALRKAHTEAAQQDRAQHQFYMSHGGRAGTAGRGMTRGTVVLAALVGACVTAAAALFYMTRVAPVRASGPAPVTAQVVAASSPAPSPGAPAEASPSPARESAPAQPVKPVSQAVPPARTKPERSAPSSQATAGTTEESVRQEAPIREEAAPPRRTSRDHFVQGETYLSPIVGPLGTGLSLSGISSARGASVAIINGNLVRAGATVGPFVIEEIEQRRVRVRYVDVIFWLTY